RVHPDDLPLRVEEQNRRRERVEQHEQVPRFGLRRGTRRLGFRRGSRIAQHMTPGTRSQWIYRVAPCADGGRTWRLRRREITAWMDDGRAPDSRIQAATAALKSYGVSVARTSLPGRQRMRAVPAPQWRRAPWNPQIRVSAGHPLRWRGEASHWRGAPRRVSYSRKVITCSPTCPHPWATCVIRSDGFVTTRAPAKRHSELLLTGSRRCPRGCGRLFRV